MPCGRIRLTGLTNRTQSAILDAYQYEYDTATMISAITRNQQKMSFAYDKTYQLTAELGRYLTNAAGGSLATATVSNQFAYDDAGNRIQLCQILDGKARVDNYTHTADNQLTGIYWNAGKLTLRGIVQDCWTAHWVKVKQSTAATWVPAQLTLRKGQNVAWVATNVPVSDTGTLTFEIQAQITNNFVITLTVTYTHSSTYPSIHSSISYSYDANGNRTEKWTNSLFAARYFYDTDNQLLGISFNNDPDYTDAGDYAYDYDPFGRRISATESGVTRYFAYDGLDCIAELDSNANVKKWFLRGTGLGGGIGDIVAEVSPMTTNYFSYNHRGDVVTLTSKDAVLTARYEYTAFGQPVSSFQFQGSSGVRPLAFSSKEYDTKSGLSYYGFRYYDAESSRWMTKDPLMWSDCISLYDFVRDNPIVDIDLYGMTAIPHPTGGKSTAQKIDWSSARVVVSDTMLDIVDPSGKNISLAISQTKYVIARFVQMNKQYECCVNGTYCEPEDFDGVLSGNEASWQIAHRIIGCVLKSLRFSPRLVNYLNQLNEIGEFHKGERFKFSTDAQYYSDTQLDMQAVRDGYATDGSQCYERFIPKQYCHKR